MSASWTRYLPPALGEWLAGREQLQQAIGNSSWLLFDRLVRLVIGLTVGAWVARYLGPALFGKLAYALSFIAFFQVVTTLQADGFIVRDLAQKRREPALILGTAFWLRLAVGALCWLAASALILVTHPEDPELCLVTMVLGGTMLFQAADTVDLWFQSQSQSRRTVLAKFVAYLLSNGVKVALLVAKAPLVALAAVTTLEAAALAAALACAYRRRQTDGRWRAGMAQAKELLHLCWPFMASSLMITVYLRIDQIMLKEMLGEKQLGIFAAALPFSQVWSVIPSTIVLSLAPLVARQMGEDPGRYREMLVKIFRFFAIVALVVSAATALLSPWIVGILYGPQYAASASILSVHVFVNLFAFQGLAQSLWVVNENVRGVTLFGTFLAAIIGVVANLWFIRSFGTIGAAYAVLVAQAFSVVVIPCLLRKDLRSLYMRAFIPLGNSGPR
jgi:O-antigen/teichoic acid export membrane protein